MSEHAPISPELVYDLARKDNTRKTATRLRLINWARFQDVTIRLGGSTLITGVNTSGKSTVLDAIMYVLCANTKFNQAADDRDRDVTGYVRGNTHSDGPQQYLRQGAVVGYIALEFWDPTIHDNLVICACIESPQENASTTRWLVKQNACLEDFSFTSKENGKMITTPVSRLTFRGEKMKMGDFLAKEKGRETVLRTLGLRCSPQQLRHKLLRMMACRTDSNLSRFIQDNVLEPKGIQSLQSLRSSMDRFQEMRSMYQQLLEKQKLLREVSRQSEKYHAHEDRVRLFRLMLVYQEYVYVTEEQARLSQELRDSESRKKAAVVAFEEAEVRRDRAQEHYAVVSSNEVIQNFHASQKALEDQIAAMEDDRTKYEEAVKRLDDLQNALCGPLRWLCLEQGRDSELLFQVAGLHTDSNTYRAAFEKLCGRVDDITGQLQSTRVHLEDQIKKSEQRLADLQSRLEALKRGQRVLPQDIQRAWDAVRDALPDTSPVRIFADLVDDIQDESWRDALEHFLGVHRFDLILNPEDAKAAVEVLKHFPDTGLSVLVGSKEEPLFSQEAGGEYADSLLLIRQADAKRAARHLLSHIRLCATTEEALRYPQGALTRDGFVVEHAAARYMDPSDIDYVLGESAIPLQIHYLTRLSEETEEELAALQEKYRDVTEKLRSLRTAQWKAEYYRFDAPQLLLQTEAALKKLQDQLEQVRRDPSIASAIAMLETAEKDLKSARLLAQKAGDEKRDAEVSCQRLAGQLQDLERSLKERTDAWEEERRREASMVELMQAQYDERRKNKNTTIVIHERQVQRLESDLDAVRDDLENAQLAYLQLMGMNLNMRGPSQIPFFLGQLREITNIEIEETDRKVKDAFHRLESDFLHDFVSTLSEQIEQARRDIRELNDTLRQLPFGQDSYRFILREKPERKAFFDICRQMSSNLLTPEDELAGMDDIGQEIQDFIHIVLAEEDEEEYTDYRRYFFYDMEITSRQGETTVTASLSKKQGSASAGEKNTPYLIILAASLLQCYPQKAVCARMAFLDEAFHALSQDRAEQLVRYFEDHHFQVIYAAPPKMIYPIGPWISTVVSLIQTGRYTQAVEGLIDVEEEEKPQDPT
ncbi:MAG: AAA family ATPase [Clostridia bacterium]|nr:AAA family ATPase [Clostridia bacterium]